MSVCYQMFCRLFIIINNTITNNNMITCNPNTNTNIIIRIILLITTNIATNSVFGAFLEHMDTVWTMFGPCLRQRGTMLGPCSGHVLDYVFVSCSLVHWPVIAFIGTLAYM
jgi:hypothetical protein